MYVDKHAQVYICLYVFKYTQRETCMIIYLFMHVYMSVCACMCVGRPLWLYTCM